MTKTFRSNACNAKKKAQLHLIMEITFAKLLFDWRFRKMLFDFPRIRSSIYPSIFSVKEKDVPRVHFLYPEDTYNRRSNFREFADNEFM